MVHRMGMNWLEFRLDEGKIRSAGGVTSLSTSLVRGMGLVVEYSAIGSHWMHHTELYIPSISADKVWLF
jgi:hypothetical protein